MIQFYLIKVLNYGCNELVFLQLIIYNLEYNNKIRKELGDGVVTVEREEEMREGAKMGCLTVLIVERYFCFNFMRSGSDIQ